MALGADLHVNIGQRRTRLEGISAGALNRSALIRRMDSKLHERHSVGFGWSRLIERKYNQGTNLRASAQVKVVLIGEDGREVILSVLGEGDFFGEMALIDDEPRSAHVIAMQDSSLLVLRREDFEQRLREAPTIALGLLRELSRRLRQADSRSRWSTWQENCR